MFGLGKRGNTSETMKLRSYIFRDIEIRTYVGPVDEMMRAVRPNVVLSAWSPNIAPADSASAAVHKYLEQSPYYSAAEVFDRARVERGSEAFEAGDIIKSGGWTLDGHTFKTVHAISPDLRSRCMTGTRIYGVIANTIAGVISDFSNAGPCVIAIPCIGTGGCLLPPSMVVNAIIGAFSPFGGSDGPRLVLFGPDQSLVGLVAQVIDKDGVLSDVESTTLYHC